MSDRKSARRIATVGKRLGKLPQTVIKSMVTRLLRLAFMMNRRSRLSATGFVLPTVVLLVLVVTLTTGALVFRAFNSSTNTIASNQNRAIYNAATPAIDRARAKLEYLFDGDKDSRFPSGVPSEEFLMSMLLNDGSKVKGTTASALLFDGKDPYVLPDENRIDLDGDAKNDNAWAYRADTNGDGTPDATVAYSIIFSTPLDEIDPATTRVKTYGWQRLIKFQDKDKAAGEKDDDRVIPYVRSGPLSNSSGKDCGGAATSGSTVESGWFRDLVSTAILRKNFQVDAIVIPDNGKGGYTTLEFQQDRQLDSGNKWGAWFRNDLELNPGSPFQWNGAMHTEGSFLVGKTNTFTAHLISSPNSCLYFPATNSEITVTKRDPDAADPDADAKAGFQGLVMAAAIEGDSGSSQIYVQTGTTSGTPPVETLNESSDWTNLGVADAHKIILDDVKVKAADGYRAKGTATTNAANRDLSKMPTDAGGTKDDGINGRFDATTQPAPYVDDLYRADDRYGPKYRYNRQIAIPASKNVGDPIGDADVLGGDAKPKALKEKNRDASGSANNVGLDGYWERRARLQGLRVLVGERLNFGNTFGWQSALDDKRKETDDPLYPAYELLKPSSTRFHEAKQRRSLRDNIAAVQGTAIYHAATADYDKPVACLASTAHPGTAETLERSLNFIPTKFKGGSTEGLRTDFFNGRGTNGWEFAPSDRDAAAMQKALKNLANYAGELDGAFPPKQETGKVHPDPVVTMWGNFSNLTRAMDAAKTNNSIADLTYKDTAACTLGMLAYNIDQLDKFDPFATGQTVTTVEGATPPSGVQYTATLQQVAKKISEVPEYDKKQPEELLALLKPNVGKPDANSNDAILRYAELIVTKAQMLRDRKYGFEISPVESSPIAYAYDAELGLPKIGSPQMDAVLTDPTYQKAIVKLYGTVKADKAQPKWPFLYYLFRFGTVVSQPNNELYVDTLRDYSTKPTTPAEAVKPSEIALVPREDDSTKWVLPRTDTPATDVRNTNPNLIVVPGGSTGSKSIAVSFLDKVMFDGRERMPARQMSIDLGLLRRTLVKNAVALSASGGTEYGSKETWLPASGIVYGFREDGVREDAINRPSGGAFSPTTLAGRTQVILGTTDTEEDPALSSPSNISLKPIDFVADPDRRVHGFRLVNGSHLRRVGGVDAKDNIRGISFITDNPAAIMGDFNIHEKTAGEDVAGDPLEEFTERLWKYEAGEAVYSDATFYSRKTRDTDFATSAGDHWRPSEVLADATSILSSDFCEGSLEDTFVTAGGREADAKLSDGSKYHKTARGLYGPSCGESNVSSFLNQNRPSTDPRTATAGGYEWVRENSADPNSPVKISANGEPLISKGAAVSEYGKTTNPTGSPSSLFDYYNHAKSKNQEPDGAARAVQDVSNKISGGVGGHRINSILVSGLVPTRQNQYNGGLHNFPRFTEWWENRALWFSGSFIQLNYTNYATAPFDQRVWEPTVSAGTANKSTGYYNQPSRYWGYDVALQLAPAGPAASRFVTVSKNRNEFYSEIPVNDPYINKLCSAAKTAKAAGKITTNGPINCPA